MSAQKEKVQELLRTLAPGATFQLVTGADPPLWTMNVNHNGVALTLNVQGDWYVFYHGFGYVPKAALVPLYRRMLEINNTMIGAWFAIDPGNQVMSLRTTGIVDELTLPQFVGILNRLSALYTSYVVGIVSEFQISITPG